MSYHVKMTPRASEQVFQIVEYIAHTLLDPESASQWFDTLTQAVDSLADFPSRFRKVGPEPWHGYGLRQMPVQNYNVFYRIDEADEAVIVIAVLYYRCNQIAMLMNMPLQ